MAVFAERLARLEALHDRLRGERPRPDNPQSWFVASTLIAQTDDVERVCAGVRHYHGQLLERLGRFTAPTSAMRWIYAAILSSNQIPIERFLTMREALRRTRGAFKTGQLHAGGARAALALALNDGDPDLLARRFFDMKTALNPPIWRRNPAITDMSAAVHVVSEHEPDAVLRLRTEAYQVFDQDPLARSYKRTASRLCALTGVGPHLALSRFQLFDDARRKSKDLRGAMSRQIAIEWACEGLQLSDVQAIAMLKHQLPKTPGLDRRERLRLAHLIHQSGKVSATDASIDALAGLTATQNAIMAASIAASSSVVTAAVAN